MIAFAKPDNIIAMPQKSNEWFTPARYVEAARCVMGSIDLDPASCFEANQIVRASHYYTIKDDGLSQEWKGNTWLNPPYAKTNNKSGVAGWIHKLLSVYRVGSIREAILLVPGDISASWFQVLWNYSICFADHHVHFKLPEPRQDKWHLGRTTNSHMWGSIFVYLGPNNEKFAEVFSEFGPVIPANVAVRRQQITPLSLWEVSK